MIPFNKKIKLRNETSWRLFLNSQGYLTIVQNFFKALLIGNFSYSKWEAIHFSGGGGRRGGGGAAPVKGVRLPQKSGAHLQEVGYSPHIIPKKHMLLFQNLLLLM